MKTSFALLALAVSALASPRPDAVSSAISPAASPPPGCTPSFSGNFEVQIVNVTTTTKRDTPLEKRVVACGGTGTLVLTLANGILTDAINRTGYIASNRQFQFDAPPQAGAIYTSGWTVCANSSLALGGSAIFYQCLSGTFYNLYDQSTGAQCSQVYIQTVGCVGGGASSSGASSSISSSSVVTSATTSVSGATSSSSSTSSSSVATVTYYPAPPVTTATVATVFTNGTTSATSAISSKISSASSATSSATAVVKQSTDGQPQATTTASAGPALSTGKGSVLAVAKGGWRSRRGWRLCLLGRGGWVFSWHDRMNGRVGRWGVIFWDEDAMYALMSLLDWKLGLSMWLRLFRKVRGERKGGGGVASCIGFFIGAAFPSGRISLLCRWLHSLMAWGLWPAAVV
ncbi:MAG: hypothetical protein FRX48_01097 [Lasallia pustulata]|uniref:Cell wall mannoprotein PIR1-like C-terminal domain-containing protein n=1 Tax=Lasallia pustulata TaxID=136370 RepID=A0A5M8Q4Q8_9LECA|nr:MAG: hypothetical protein FRX48_01097 [Lasallia pustulata]